MIRSAKEDQPSASVPAPPSSSNTTACRYKNPLGSSTTLLTFTTKSGELIDADVDYDSGLDEHTIARIDQAKCSECKVDTRMAPAANKDLELDETIITGTKGAPVTERRKPFVQNEGHEQLKQAGRFITAVMQLSSLSRHQSNPRSRCCSGVSSCGCSSSQGNDHVGLCPA